MNAETFQRVGERAPALLAALDGAGRFLWANESWRRELGYDPAALRGREFVALLHPDESLTHPELLSDAEASQPSDTRRARLRAQGGEWMWVDWFRQPLGEGLFYARNVSAVIADERARAQQVALMQLTEEMALVGSWSVDVASGQVRWSPQVYRIHGLDPVPNATLSVEEAVRAYHPDDQQRVSDLVSAAALRGTPFQFELRILRPDGELRHVLSHGRCDVDPESGETRTIFGTFQDVTERDAARDRAAHNERLMTAGTLAAGVGHEMNNPLTHLQLNLDLIAEELHALAGASPSGRLKRVVQHLDESVQAVNRLKTIVRGLRSFARDDSEPTAVDLRRTVELSLNLSMHEIRHTATCRVEIGDVPLLSADETRLAQVLVNLICNAAHSFAYGDPEHNLIQVTARRLEGDRIEICVADNGSGIPPATAARIFDPFFTTKAAGEGTGLGLAISRSIVEGFGGELSYVTTPGAGSTFRIELNAFADDASLPEAAPADATVSPPANGRVLIVDDEPALGSILQRGLSAECTTQYFQDPREALLYLQTVTPPDLVLCDLSMPYLNGMQLFAEAVRHRPVYAERFVFMSGGVTDEAARAFLDSVDNERLDKPFDLSAVRALVRRRLSRASVD